MTASNVVHDLNLNGGHLFLQNFPEKTKLRAQPILKPKLIIFWKLFCHTDRWHTSQYMCERYAVNKTIKVPECL